MIYTEINPIDFPPKGIGKFIVVEPQGYILGGTSAEFRYRILDNVDLSSVPLEGEEITSGTKTMSQEELELWGIDDNYPIDWMLSKLNLQKKKN